MTKGVDKPPVGRPPPCRATGLCGRSMTTAGVGGLLSPCPGGVRCGRGGDPPRPEGEGEGGRTPRGGACDRTCRRCGSGRGTGDVWWASTGLGRSTADGGSCWVWGGGGGGAAQGRPRAPTVRWAPRAHTPNTPTTPPPPPPGGAIRPRGNDGRFEWRTDSNHVRLGLWYLVIGGFGTG